jgi:imidazolonepropionase-like amidohydrolase
MDVRRSAAMILRFPLLQSGGGRFGGGGAPGARTRSFSEATRDYERQVAGLRDFFDQARRYQRAKAAAAPGFRTDLKFEAMLPVLDRKLPVMVTAIRRRAIRDAIDFADREKVRIILAESREVAPFAAELKSKDIPVILGPTLALPLERDDPYDAAFTLPAELHKAGVKFAFGSFGNQFARNLPYQAAASVAFGLPYAEALKAVTLNPAEIWGVAEKLGSIDKGKWADLVLTDSDILETRTQVKQVFIQGRHVDLDNKHHRLYQKYLNRP